MKTYLLHGIALAVVNFLFTLVLFIFGLHSDPAKIGLAGGIGSIGGLIIMSVIIALGMKAARAKSPASEPFTYGNAFGAGAWITVVASLLALVTHSLYIRVIDPQFTEILIQAKLNRLEARGITGDQYDRAEKIIRASSGPFWQTIAVCIGCAILGLIISLIVAAFFRREAAPPTLESSAA